MHSIDECYSIYEGQHLTISTSVTSPKVGEKCEMFEKCEQPVVVYDIVREYPNRYCQIRAGWCSCGL